MTIEEARKLTDEEIRSEYDRRVKLYNESHDDWHRKCLTESMEALEEVAAERNIEI